jgi:crotonobetainyl-CoA:carnitine CoA-transferase CaiB-like acyl-CoA transferase
MEKGEEFSDESAAGRPAWTGRYLREWTINFGSYELAEMLQKVGITAAASISTKQCTHDRHLDSRGFFIKTDHPVLGKVYLTGLPFCFSDMPKGNYATAPLLGQHNEYVFGELLGLSRDEINTLIADKVLY